MRVVTLLVCLPVLAARAETGDETETVPGSAPAGPMTGPCSEPAVATEPEPGPAPSGGGPPVRTPALRAVRAVAAPKIDGDVSDAAWAAAPLFDAFVLNQPTEGGPASERTEMR